MLSNEDNASSYVEQHVSKKRKKSPDLEYSSKPKLTEADENNLVGNVQVCR